MKKYYSIVLVVSIMIIIMLVMTGCSNNKQDSSNADSSNKSSLNRGEAKNIEQGNTYSTSNKIEFSLFKIKTADKLQSSTGNGSYFSAENGNNYVDIVISLTNNSDKELSIKDNIKAYFENNNGTKYEKYLVAVESRDDFLDQFGSVKPLATNKVHIGYQVPNEVSKGKAYFEINGENFVVNYDSSVDVSSKKTINMNEEIAADNTAKFKILSTKYTADVLPPNVSGFYTHYPVDDPSNNVFFVVYCDLTNDSSSAIRSDDMISIKAIFDGKYEYTANMALEKKDGSGFDYSNITNINPLETRKAVFMFEVPKKVQDMDYELSIYFYGNEYSCHK